MPDFTIIISDKVIARLQALATAHNQATGQSLTAKQWVIMYIKNVVINEELHQQIDAMTEANEQQLREATQAKRLEILDTYG